VKPKLSVPILLAAAALALGGPRADEPAWTSIGPEGGCLVDLAVNFANPNDLLAVFQSIPAQVFRTTNGGRSWRRIGLFDDGVIGVAFGAPGSGRLYAMSRSALLATRNGGATWSAVAPPGGFDSLDRLAAHPKDPDGLVILGRMSGASAALGVAVTTDGGATWKAKQASLAADSVEGVALCVHPANPANIYVSGLTWTGGWSRSGIYRSTNGGASWEDITGPLTSLVYELAGDPADPSKAYAATYGGVYRTADAGRTWVAAEGSVYGLGLAVDPAAPSTLFAGGQKTVFKSTDGGVRWSTVSSDLPGTCRRMAVAGGAVFYGSDAGIFRSADAGMSWAPAQDGIAACRVPSFFVSPSSPNVLYANVSGRGFYRSGSFGRAWTLLPYFYQCDGAGRIAAVPPGDPQIVYMLAPGEG
jgi:photosystem II stability/assembly factor-like uncharacterized protein